MLTSNVQLGYVFTRGGGQAVQGGLSCPPPRISERMDNPQILLHHLLWEYLVERDINFVSVSLSALGGGGGASCPGQFILPTPRPEFQREWIIRKFYYTIYNRNI